MQDKLKMLLNLMKGNRLRYLGAIIAVAFATLFSYISPLIIRFTIDSVIGDKPMDAPEFITVFIKNLGGPSRLQYNLWIPGLLLVGVTLLQGLFTYLKGRWSAESAEATAQNLRDKLYDHLQRLPFSYHSTAETGDLIQRCTSDVETIRRFLAMQFVEVGRALIMVATVIPIMLYLDVRMTIVSMAVVPIIFVFAVIFFNKVKTTFKMVDESEGELSTVLQENLTGTRVVRAFARQDYEIGKFDEKNVMFRDNVYRLLILLAWYWSSSDLLCMFQIAAVLILGAFWAAEGSLSLGTLVVFITYEGLLLWPVRQMGRILTDWGKTLVSLDRVKEIFDVSQETMTESEHGNGKFKIEGNIEFRDVTFAYTASTPVLNGISFTVDAGQSVAILGPTGSGKSTLVNLLPRLYDYSKGSIKIDGKELKTMDKKWIRENIGIVLQEPFLFSKNIKENIGLGKAEFTDGEIYQAAKTSAVHDVILNFDHGYETAVGERGVTLSGGQKQRVAIARALIQEPPILIFDDSLSAVDTETDRKIQNALKQRKGKATTFIVSHRITTVSQADLILVLEDGKISQAGTHEELLSQSGLYRRTYDIQNSLETETETEIDEMDEIREIEARYRDYSSVETEMEEEDIAEVIEL